MILLCILRGMYRSFISTTVAYRGHWISGCNWKTDDDTTPENVHILKCEDCGKYDIAWSWDSLEASK